MLRNSLSNIAKDVLQAIVPLVLALQALLIPGTAKANEYLQCVPFARDLSGIQIYGDAHLWWGKAAGRYERGSRPTEGAVMALKSHESMELGHVAVVSRIIDDRNILISHANWSPINGRRGQIERNVAARDVSENNDWSRVRIWYAPISKLGTTAFPVNGFIYPRNRSAKPQRHWTSAGPAAPVGRKPDRRLFDEDLQSELVQQARYEQQPAQPEDLIGELLDSLGS